MKSNNLYSLDYMMPLLTKYSASEQRLTSLLLWGSTLSPNSGFPDQT
jgi:hypothetical protein